MVVWCMVRVNVKVKSFVFVDENVVFVKGGVFVSDNWLVFEICLLIVVVFGFV